MTTLEEKKFLNAEDVCAILGVKRTRGYDTIKALNKQLEASGMMTVKGRINAEYFKKKLLNVDGIE